MTNTCKFVCTAILFLVASPLFAGDVGDAPAPYPNCNFWGNGPTLGPTATDDLTDPVTPAWTGDSDDGVLIAPTWDAGTTSNSLSVTYNVMGWGDENLYLYVDDNDDGFWDTTERYKCQTSPLMTSGSYTFNNIKLRTMNYTLNGPNKVAVRLIIINEDFGIPPSYGGGSLYGEGEVEDYLFDVNPVGFAVVFDNPLPDAREGDFYSAVFFAVNGTTPYQWSVVGTLPAGLTFKTRINAGSLAGTPQSGSANIGGADYPLQFICNDVGGHQATKFMTLHVNPAPRALPFRDDFSTSLGWSLSQPWQRGSATSFGVVNNGTMYSEPGVDTSPGSDNMILGDTIGGAYGAYGAVKFAISPMLDCSHAAQVSLRFNRDLTIDEWKYDQARIEVTNDGVHWYNVWSNQAPNGPGSQPGSVLDQTWRACNYDITMVASGQARVQIRFSIGLTDATGFYTGWCIDDFEVIPNALPGGVGISNLSIKTGATGGSGNGALFTGSTYAVDVTFNSFLSEPATIDYFKLSIVLPLGVVSYDAGTLTLNFPITVPAFATGVVAHGAFNCLAVPPTAASTYAFVFTAAGSGQISGGYVECPAIAYYEINLGPSTVPQLEVYSSGAFVLSPVPASSANFGTRDINLGPSMPMVITIANSGYGTINLGTPMVSAGDVADFSLDTSTFTNVLGGVSITTIHILFDPATVGDKIATITFTHDASSCAPSPFVINVMGTGVDSIAAIEVRAGGPTGTILVNGAPAAGLLDFGQQEINSGPSAGLLINVANVGSQTLQLPTAPLLGGTNGPDFTLDVTGYLSSLAPGANTTFTIYFDPNIIGPKSALVNIDHTGPNTAQPFVINVLGMAILIAPQIEVRQATTTGAAILDGDLAYGTLRDFGPRNIVAGPTGTLAIFVINTGNAPLNLTQVQLTGADAAEFLYTPPTGGISVAPGNWTLMDLRFDPTTEGAKSAWLEFDHDATAGHFHCELAGTGTPPLPLAFTTSAALPAVEQGESYGPVWIAAEGGLGPYTYTLNPDDLPSGMEFNSAGRIIGLTHGEAKLYVFNVTATDALGATLSQDFTLLVQPTPSNIQPPSQVNGSSQSAGCQADAAANWPVLLLLALGCMTLLDLRRRSRRA